MTALAPRTRLPLAVGALCLSLLSGCEQPPQDLGEKVEAPPIDGPAQVELRRQAHREALQAALETSRSALEAIDPMAAYRAGHGPPAYTPLTLAARARQHSALELARRETGEIDETQLAAPEVVILRALRFGLNRAYDEVERRPRTRIDPNWPLDVSAETVAELRYRVLSDDCDATCEALPAQLATDLGTLPDLLEAASMPAVTRARIRAQAQAESARQFASGLRELGHHTDLATSLDTLATSLDTHAQWLEKLELALPKAEHHHTWTAEVPPLRPGGIENIERLPGVMGPQATVRWLSVEERLDVDPSRAFADIERHVRRWRAIETQLLAGDTGAGDTGAGDTGAEAETGSEPGDAASVIASDPARALTPARCEAASAQVRAGMIDLEGPDTPGSADLDCETFVALAPRSLMSEGALLIAVLDLTVIEPQRRALVHEELPELALIRGRWSEQLHLHLRHVMLLARIEHPQARAAAVVEGRRALCLAEAALWIHAELGPSDEVALAVGEPCALLGDADAITAEVLADPRAAMAGIGLSLIGDEPARMVGFDRFFWAPLGLMQTLATPPGMHPDGFVMPTEADQSGRAKPPTSPRPKLEVSIEDL